LAECALRRQTPEVGAECPNWARSELSGGRSETNVPTGNTFAAGGAAVRPEKKFNARPAGGVERSAGGLKTYICNEPHSVPTR
jgi:hypothetical protein